MYYQIINAENEEIGLVWQYINNKPVIENIFLPCPHNKLIFKIKRFCSEVNLTERNIPDDIDQKIRQIYSGSKVNIKNSFLNYTKLTKFSTLVLKQTCKIPPGKVDTNSGLAEKIGSPGAARAVGNVMANNPFPILVPCHRVVRSNGSMGGFGGGIKMKKELLCKEGVILNVKNRVAEECFYKG
ncbi:MAG: MGMT family protein [Smithella sp.]